MMANNRRITSIVMTLILLNICVYENHGTHINGNDVTDAVANILNLSHARRMLEKDLNKIADDCDCGENALGCTIDIYGDKCCSCKEGFAAVEDGICRKRCVKYDCKNDGSCDVVCRCPKYVSGEICETIDECRFYAMCGDSNVADCTDFRDVNNRPRCKCKNSSLTFDQYDRLCKECSCGEKGNSCYFDKGKKVCNCQDGYLSVQGTCNKCDCGEWSTGCSYSEDGQKVCACQVGYGQLIETCAKCDCGIGANCHLHHVSEVCDCLEGYKEYNKTCKECNCGEFGNCELLLDGNKLCYCDPGYVEKDGKCTECYCGSYEFRCRFENGNKNCSCPKGYEDNTGYCEDINECEDPNACPTTATCVNRVGSYYCVCRDGFQMKKEDPDPEKFGCHDIDECANSNACIYKHSVCYNTIGSYKCACANGYSSLDFYSDPKLLQCTKNSPVSEFWKTATIIITVIMIIVRVAVTLYPYIRRRCKAR